MPEKRKFKETFQDSGKKQKRRKFTSISKFSSFVCPPRAQSPSAAAYVRKKGLQPTNYDAGKLPRNRKAENDDDNTTASIEQPRPQQPKPEVNLASEMQTLTEVGNIPRKRGRPRKNEVRRQSFIKKEEVNSSNEMEMPMKDNGEQIASSHQKIRPRMQRPKQVSVEERNRFQPPALKLESTSRLKPEELKQMLNYRNENGDLVCRRCKEVFGDYKELTKHERLHTQLKPYQCDVCKKFFATGLDLKIHEKVHKWLKPFRCKSCRRGFCTKVQLKYHGCMKSKQVVCDECPNEVVFKTHREYAKHMQIHEGYNPEECTICGHRFGSSEKLKEHKRNMHLFECSLCKENLMSEELLAQHLVKVHVTQMSQDKRDQETFQDEQDQQPSDDKQEQETSRDELDQQLSHDKQKQQTSHGKQEQQTALGKQDQQAVHITNNRHSQERITEEPLVKVVIAKSHEGRRPLDVTIMNLDTVTWPLNEMSKKQF